MELKINPVIQSSFIQTVLPVYLPTPNLSQDLIRHEISLRDSDKMAIYISNNVQDEINILIHGLTGSVQSNYVKRNAYFFNQHKIHYGLVNLRGSDCVIGKNKKPYHSGLSQDIEDLVFFLIKLGYQKINLIGFSLGANLILKYLSSHTIPSEINKSICISPPCDLADSVKKMQKVYFSIFNKFFAGEIIKLSKQNNIEIPSELLTKKVDLKMVDHFLTAKTWGYKNADDYYYKASTNRDLNKIQQKTYILIAQDDPISSTSWVKTVSNPLIDILITKHGGHVGFMDHFKKFEMRFLDKFILNKIKE